MYCGFKAVNFISLHFCKDVCNNVENEIEKAAVSILDSAAPGTANAAKTDKHLKR